MAQTLVLEYFPEPKMARRLSPNGRAHWAVKKLARDYVRQRLWLEKQTKKVSYLGTGLVTMKATFIYPVARKRDDDNLATGILKAVRDALVDLVILQADDMEHLRQLPVEVRVEKGRRALILEFSEAPAGTPP